MPHPHGANPVTQSVEMLQSVTSSDMKVIDFPAVAIDFCAGLLSHEDNQNKYLLVKHVYGCKIKLKRFLKYIHCLMTIVLKNKCIVTFILFIVHRQSSQWPTQ